MSMSDILETFKQKIEDAVSMVPDMIAEEKLRAVQLWNIVSERLQEIVNNSAADITALAFQIDKDKFPDYLDGSLTVRASPGIVSGLSGCGGIASQFISADGGAYVSPSLVKKYIGRGDIRTTLMPAPLLGIQRSRMRGSHVNNNISSPLSSTHPSTILLSAPARCSPTSVTIESPLHVGMGVIVKGVGEDECILGNTSRGNSVIEVACGERKESVESEGQGEASDQESAYDVLARETSLLNKGGELLESSCHDESMAHLRAATDHLESASNVSANSLEAMSEKSSVCGLDKKRMRIDSTIHMKGDVKNYACQDCKSTFSSKGNLIVHIRRHTGEKPYICVHCESRFSTKGNLKRHLKAHLGIKPWECTTCGGRFTEKKSLKVHMRRHTGEKPYQCDICSKKFSQSGILQSHMAMHLNQKAHLCELCGKSFRQKSQLRLHMQRHQGVRKFNCTHCSSKFLTKGDMIRHKRTHTGERPFKCPLCGKTFTRQQSLNEHKNRHYGHKPYSCKYCSKGFAEMSACYKHIKSHEKAHSSGKL